MHRTKQTTSRTTRPLLAPDVDGRVLEFCEPLELGRCAAVSTGLRAAADIAWRPVATTRFPLLASIARAAGGKFGYASACRSQLKCHKDGVAPPCIRELIRPHSYWMEEGELANIVVTYALHTVRELPARPHNMSSTGWIDATYRPPRYEDEPPGADTCPYGRRICGRATRSQPKCANGWTPSSLGGEHARSLICQLFR